MVATRILIAAALAVVLLPPASAVHEELPLDPVYEALDCSFHICDENDGWVHVVNPHRALHKDAEVLVRPDDNGWYHFEQHLYYEDSTEPGVWQHTDLTRGDHPWTWIAFQGTSWFGLGEIYNSPGVTRDAQPDGSILWGVSRDAFPAGFFDPTGTLSLAGIQSGVMYKPRTTDDNGGNGGHYSGGDSNRQHYDESHTAECQALATDADGVNTNAVDRDGNGVTLCPYSTGWFNTAKNVLVENGPAELRDILDLIDRVPTPVVLQGSVDLNHRDVLETVRGIVQAVTGNLQVDTDGDAAQALPLAPDRVLRKLAL